MTTNAPNSGNQYGSDQIKHLAGIEGIRKRPAMYIGGTDSVGLHHLVWEVVDNSIDEAGAGFATFIGVTVNADGSLSVVDDGRGIPVGPVAALGGRSALDVVFTEIHAGGKFDRQGGYAKGTGGLHGVGITAVNACSEWLEAEVRREGHVWTMAFAKGVLSEPLKALGTTDQTGTKITFQPDPTIFATVHFDHETLHRRMQDLAFLNPGLRIRLVDERTGQTEEFCHPDGLADFIRWLNRTETPLFPDVIRIAGEQDGVEVAVALQYNDGYSESVRAYANNIYNPDGGTHLSGFKAALTRCINNYGKAENIYKDFVPSGDDFREGLAAIVTVRIPEPQFESQTKVKLTNAEVEGAVTSVVNEGLARFFEENPAVAKNIATKGLRAAEAREAARKARELARKENRVSGGGLPEKLRDCRSSDLAVTELYLVEGDSAGGSADTGRDSFCQAILPLRGKILNVEKAQLVKILGNAEVANIFKAVGVPPGAELEDVAKRRYGKLVLMTDADVDGSHIRTLLLTFIFRHLRPLVQNGCVYIAQPPLYRVVQKKKVRYVQTHEQMMSELVEFGLSGSSLRCEDGTVLDEPVFRQVVDVLRTLEEPLETLDRRGIDLRHVSAHHLTSDGLLPRFRVFLGRVQHWFADKEALEAFLSEERARRGGELKVADRTLPAGDGRPAASETPGDEPSGHDGELQVVDLHEARAVNQALRQLKGYGFELADFAAAGHRNGEPFFPFAVLHGDGETRLASLREILPALRKIGEKGQGLRITRFKGLGEMDSEELWETSMNPAHRTLLQVTLQDAAAADEIFRVLMGDSVEPRREFIEKHALEVKDLDV